MGDTSRAIECSLNLSLILKPVWRHAGKNRLNTKPNRIGLDGSSVGPKSPAAFAIGLHDNCCYAIDIITLSNLPCYLPVINDVTLQNAKPFVGNKEKKSTARQPLQHCFQTPPGRQNHRRSNIRGVTHLTLALIVSFSPRLDRTRFPPAAVHRP